MTSPQATAGDVTAAPASAAATPAAAPATTPEISVTDSFTGIPSSYASDPDFQNFKSVDDVFTEFKTLKSLQTQREQSGLIQLIDENSTPEQVAAFYEKLGKPKAAAEYELAKPEDFPDGLDYSDEQAATFAQFALENNFTKAQTQAVFSYYHNMLKDAHATGALAEETTLANNLTTLEEKWGAKYGTEQFTQKHQNAMRAFNFAAGTDTELAAAFKENKAVASNPLVLDVLARLGSKLTADHVPTVGDTLPVGKFEDSVQAIDRRIDEFKKSDKWSKMLGSSEDGRKAKEEWQALWSKRRELSAQI